MPLLGLLRSPTQGKPARHNSPPAYAAFPQSLRVIWVFDTRANKELALANGADQRMRELTAAALQDAEVASATSGHAWPDAALMWELACLR
ncbi:hypothetical protein [Pseudomonas sp. WS 5146]|uniref:hypothetical protein n=1 Tax=Pseudomonas sp. WS 5146 TaxID=2717494 RepID=UPI0014738579|nr:hypothetical protein [Pseudomonas sp. WS 5146]NMX54283.1 hypothetical protein [Pseudomonas sp. WS 5146]